MNSSGLYSRVISVSGIASASALDELDGIDGHLHNFSLAHAEDVVAEGLAGGVIDVDDGLLRALQGLEGAANEMLAGLGEDFDRDVVGNVAAFDEVAHEAEFRFGSRGEGDLDFLEADGAEHPEHTHLLLGVHRLEKRLVAVAEVGAHPDRRLRDGAVGPVAVDEVDRGKSVVLGGGILHHGAAPESWTRWSNLKEKSPAGACVLWVDCYHGWQKRLTNLIFEQ